VAGLSRSRVCEGGSEERAGQGRTWPPALETLGRSDCRELESAIGGVGRKIGIWQLGRSRRGGSDGDLSASRREPRSPNLSLIELQTTAPIDAEFGSGATAVPERW
jgi:hypothetical protein